MIDGIPEKITKRYLIVSLILVLLIGLFNLAFYAPWFSSVANGYPYLETKLFYTPEDLISMADGYGEAGRALYIRSALTLDLLTPLLAANFLTALAVYISKKEHLRRNLTPGAALCLSDWLENIIMIALLSSWPETSYPLAVAGRVMTSVKYLLMVIFAALIIQGAVQQRRRR